MDKNTFYLRIDELLEAAPGTVTGATELASLEAWDSLALMGFIALVDSHYKVNLPAKEITACQTVDDLAALVAAHQP